MRIGLGIFLLVIGAVLAFGVTYSFSGVDIAVIGYILMAGGVAALVLSALAGRRSTVRRDTAVDSQGRRSERTSRTTGEDPLV